MHRVTGFMLACCLVLQGALAGAAVPAVEDVVMYEVNPRAFSASGDLDGVTAELDRIADLGVNVIWLMPIHPIGEERRAGELGSPYSVRDYRAVNPEFGTLEDLKELVTAAHEREMAVILDWVANHTAWDHAWVEAQPGWYTHDEGGAITHPEGTNWLDVADLNYDAAGLRAAMTEAMVYWVEEVGVDGFRCDFSDGVPVDFWASAIEAVRGSVDRPVLMLAEGTRPENLTEAGFDLNYDWSFYDALKRVFTGGEGASVVVRTHRDRYRGLPSGRHWLRWVTNHDQYAWEASPSEVFGSDRAVVAAFAGTLYVGGVPLLYNGQELGVAETIPFFTRAPLAWSEAGELRERYIELIEVYQEHEVLRRGRLNDLSNADVLAFERYGAGERALVLINTRRTASTIVLPWARVWRDARSGRVAELPRQVVLEPYEIHVLVQP